MATDLDTGKEQGGRANVRPSLKITGLHIRGLKSIKALDLPQDGLGWDGEIPDLVMVGGINGSGKTTLLKFIANIFDFAGSRHGSPAPTTINAWVDFQFELSEVSSLTHRYVIGDKDFADLHAKEADWYGLEIGRSSLGLTNSARFPDHLDPRLSAMIASNHAPVGLDLPAVVYFPSEGRGLVIPETSYKMPGSLAPSDEFVQGWRPPENWEDSIPARLYALRWEDLNAKEEGRPEDATHFQSYHLAFDRFFEGRKRLRWTPKGELVVETKGGDIHELADLSSGEKQVILFMGELLHRWRPGSLILIDEPELHLHEYYQTRLWESLVDFQRERGGQLILATQSAHLFKLGGLGSRLILGGWPG